jgi:hypothetical protein
MNIRIITADMRIALIVPIIITAIIPMALTITPTTMP